MEEKRALAAGPCARPPRASPPPHPTAHAARRTPQAISSSPVPGSLAADPAACFTLCKAGWAPCGPRTAVAAAALASAAASRWASRRSAPLAAGESVIKCPSPPNVLKDTYDHSCY
jgi:hypothetical protein